VKEARDIFFSIVKDRAQYEVVKEGDLETYIFPEHPLLNFLQLLVITLSLENVPANGKKFMSLYNQYKELLKITGVLGGIELDEGDDFIVTAVRETWEEAGVEGKIVKKLPVVYDSRGAKAPVIKGEWDPLKVTPKSEFHFYELIVEKLSMVWPESEMRERKWCSYSEARHELIKAKRPELAEVLASSEIIKDTEEF
jgi:hypothetical protein